MRRAVLRGTSRTVPVWAPRRLCASQSSELSQELREEESGLPSIEISEEAENAEEFDVVEATLQEVHDISCAVVEAMELRYARPTPSGKTGLQASRLYLEWMDKVDAMLTPDVVKALAKSARHSVYASPRRLKSPTVASGDELEKLRRRLLQPVATAHKHAPFEMLNSRANNPECVTRLMRAERDASTLRNIWRATEEMTFSFNSHTIIKISRKLEAMVE
jgi:hypothetical protein